MAHLYKKVKKGREYYYIRENQRVKGKSTTVNQVYLGTADKVETLLGRGGISPKEFGSVFVINELDKDLDLAGIVNEILPPKKRTKGPSLGDMVFYAALNRAIAPTSKRQLAAWYETTDIQRIRPLRLESLNSQNFWNHWDRINDSDLERIAVTFFKKVNSLWANGERRLLIEAARLPATPKSPLLAEAWPDEEFVGQPQQPGSGLALVSAWPQRVPLSYQIFSGNLSEGTFFDRGLDGLLARVAHLGVPVKDVTLLFHRGIDSEALVSRLNGQEGLHFIASCPPEAAPELTKISMKEFSPLPGLAQGLHPTLGDDDGQALFYETRADFWGRSRRVFVTFDPEAFQKSYWDLGKKVRRVRREMAALEQGCMQAESGKEVPQALKDRLTQLCQRLQISPSLFKWVREKGRSHPVLELDHCQMADSVRNFGKQIYITDREDWAPAEIFEACSSRWVQEAQSPGGKINGLRAANGGEPLSAMPVAPRPFYHWTGSKIRVHLFVCVAAMTYLALLCQRLSAQGFHLAPREAVEELRSLRTAIFKEKEDGKLKRMVEPVSNRQSAILRAMGYQVKDGDILPL
ncbi:MAG: hypothetical protein WCF59_03420 [Desulfobaccales bacterium]|jgi:hypothetical protein